MNTAGLWLGEFVATMVNSAMGPEAAKAHSEEKFVKISMYLIRNTRA